MDAKGFVQHRAGRFIKGRVRDTERQAMETLDLILVLAAGWGALLMLVLAALAAASRADDAADELLARVSPAPPQSETARVRVRTRERAPAGLRLPIQLS